MKFVGGGVSTASFVDSYEVNAHLLEAKMRVNEQEDAVTQRSYTTPQQIPPPAPPAGGEQTPPPAPSADEQTPPPVPRSQSSPEQVELFTDSKSGLWAGVTTIFCVAVVGAGNLLLLAATLGQGAPNSQHWDIGNLMIWVMFVGLAVGTIIGLLRFILPVKPWREMKDGWVTALGAAGIGFLSSGVIVGVLYVIAWNSAVGDQPFAWQPVVGFTMSVVALASFGGYYLASRRSRVGFAASFVMTFLVLLSFMLTLDGLARAADGTGMQDAAAQGAARAVQDLLTDFRGSVALIVGFYFGTDAAVSVAKMLRTTGRDAAQISRLDRDLAVPPQ